MTHDWFRKAFAQGYLEIYAHRNEQEAEEMVALFRRVTGLADGSVVLDIPCGAGRHVDHFRAAGYRAAGMDLSMDLLHYAANRGTRIIARADMRRVPARSGRADAVVNLFTSFGYFPTDSENDAVLLEFARLLRPGGWLVVDAVNAPWLRSTLVPESERTLSSGGVVRESRQIIGTPPRVEKRITWTTQGAERQWHESVRIYDTVELRYAIARAGLRTVAVFGDYKGNAVSDATPRCIAFAKLDASSAQPSLPSTEITA